GEILIEMRLISTSELEEILRFQVEEEICDLYSWKQGVYEFRPEERLPKELDASAVRLHINPAALLVESAKRMRLWEGISAVISSPLAVYQLTPSGQELLKTAAKSGRRVLTMVDEGLPVEEIVRRSFLGRFGIYKALADLVRAGCIIERDLEGLEHLAAEKVRGNSYATARFIYRRLLELAKAPIEIERAREQLAYLDELERTSSKVMAAKPGGPTAAQAQTEASIVTKAMALGPTRKLPAGRKVRPLVVGVFVLLLVALGATAAVFSIPALSEYLLDPGKKELGVLFAGVDNHVAAGEYEAAYRACQAFLVRHPAGASRKEVEKRIEELRGRMDEEVRNGISEASTYAMAGNYRNAMGRLDSLLESFPSSSLRAEVIKLQEKYKREWAAYVEQYTVKQAREKIVEARKLFEGGRLEDAAHILNDIQSAPRAPEDTKQEAALLRDEIKNLERLLDDIFKTALNAEAAGDYEGALLAYRRIVSRAPQSSRSHKARSNLEAIEDTKRLLRQMLERADAQLSAGKPAEAVRLLEQVARRKGYTEADAATERLVPLKDKYERSRRVLTAYKEAIAKEDFASAARYARMLHDEYSPFINAAEVMLPVAVHSVPSGAAVSVDGGHVGFTPCTALVRSDRRAPMRLTHEGYQPSEIIIDDTSKTVYRIYLERVLKRRLSLPGMIAAAETLDKSRLAIVLKARDGDDRARLLNVSLADGSTRESAMLPFVDVEATAFFGGILYCAGYGRIAAVEPGTGKTRIITEGLARDAQVALFFVERAQMMANKVIAAVLLSDGRYMGFTVDDAAKMWDEKVVTRVERAALGGGVVLIYDGERVSAVERAGSRVRWTVNSGPLWAGPAASPVGWFCYVDQRPMVVLGNLAQGELASQAPLGGVRHFYPPLRLVAGRDYMYLCSAEFFYILHHEKGVIQDASLDRKILHDPLVTEKHIYLVGEGALYRLSA
ncbi:MAG TPA: PEGA domain-containing protein, partial [Planctomycetes bacterium]|nr:PEGA domain-containing protein [Planctomycetota bacterium]